MCPPRALGNQGPTPPARPPMIQIKGTPTPPPAPRAVERAARYRIQNKSFFMLVFLQ